MRLKEGKSSWKSSGIRKRDHKNSRDEGRQKPQTAKKDTAKWCKGKVGSRHKYSVFRVNKYRFGSIMETFTTYKCSVCGKQKISISTKK